MTKTLKHQKLSQTDIQEIISKFRINNGLAENYDINNEHSFMDYLTGITLRNSYSANSVNLANASMEQEQLERFKNELIPKYKHSDMNKYDGIYDNLLKLIEAIQNKEYDTINELIEIPKEKPTNIASRIDSWTAGKELPEHSIKEKIQKQREQKANKKDNYNAIKEPKANSFRARVAAKLEREQRINNAKTH